MARPKMSNADLQIKLESEIKEKTAKLNQLREKRRLEVGKLAEKYNVHLWSDAELAKLFETAVQGGA